jgi:hypothetical protein
VNDQNQREAKLSWIEVAPGASYFTTDRGQPWTPIGQNDAISWVDLQGSFRQKDLPSVEAYLQHLAAHGVTCLRLMLEYSHVQHRYLERPAGHFVPNMVRLWDDLFMLCERHGLRILLTPFDTFWMWKRWAHHPYNRANGGPCSKRSEWLLSKGMREATKARLAFATERWGGSGALFAWDIWNEIHPAHAGDSSEVFADFVEDVSSFLRKKELELHGRAHPQTVSVFEPVLDDPLVAECAFRHPLLDFASTHFYEHPAINKPKNTVDAAIATGRLVRKALAETRDQRPFFDSEHGPIHTFKDLHKTLPESFDDEYFRHMQWAHLASGAAGGGMRWPNRHPHSLTAGMRVAQLGLANFLPLIDWTRFQRRNWNEEICLSHRGLAGFACGDEAQAVVWLLRKDSLQREGTVRQDAKAATTSLRLPGLGVGSYKVTAWDTLTGKVSAQFVVEHQHGDDLCLEPPPIHTDLALALQRI